MRIVFLLFEHFMEGIEMTEENYSIEMENRVVRQLSKIAYFFKPQKLVLNDEQYCHVIDKDTGNVSTREGECKIVLDYDEAIVGNIEDKVVVKENWFAVIKNPLSNDGSTIQYGEREVRTGPNRFALHFGEKVEDLREEYVLTKYDALLVKALNDFGDHKVGDEYLIKGAGKFIPCKHEEVKYELKGISLSDTEGKYVQDKDTGDARLVEGTEESEIYFLKSNERMFRKELTLDELVALGLKTQSSRDGVRVLTRQAANSSFLEDSSNALVLELEDNELVYIYDGSESRIEQGPKTTFLGPYERPKILNLSGGRPIEPNALKIALLKLGPDFIYDEIVVRTKDNARLRLNVTYKWRFDFDSDNLKKAFSIDDFVGYAAETLSSEIRSVAAKYDFEEFHERLHKKY